MSECVILYRVNGGKVEIVYDLKGEVYVFPDMDAAVASTCDGSNLFTSGEADYQIVELDEP